MREDRPKLTAAEQIHHMQKKGITFDVCSQDEALQYLKENNNYFKLRAYRKNYPKDANGRYLHLDFAYLRDLSIIDMRMRYCLLEMCLDVEHSFKVRLMKAIDESNEDGYQVVEDFIALKRQGKSESLYKNARTSEYCGELLKKYEADMPIWVLIEIVSFHDFLELYKFCALRLENKSMQNEYYLLQEVRWIRNACAHSNCILNDLHPCRAPAYRPNYDVMRAIGLLSISKETRIRRMSNPHIRQITTLLYVHMTYIPSKGIHARCCHNLQELSRRMFEHVDYYLSNPMVYTTFAFFKNIIDNWFPSVL